MNNIFFPKKSAFSFSFLVKNIDAAIHKFEVLFRNDATHLLPGEAEDLTVPAMAYLINHKLYIKKDGSRVTEAHIWRTIFVNPEIFVREGTIIHLLM